MGIDRVSSGTEIATVLGDIRPNILSKASQPRGFAREFTNASPIDLRVDILAGCRIETSALSGMLRMYWRSPYFSLIFISVPHLM
jgi:hypothetical protein